MSTKIEIECIDRNGEPFFQVWLHHPRTSTVEIMEGKPSTLLLGVTDCDSAFDFARAEMLERIEKGGWENA